MVYSRSCIDLLCIADSELETLSHQIAYDSYHTSSGQFVLGFAWLSSYKIQPVPLSF